MVIFSGNPWRRIALVRKHMAARSSRCSVGGERFIDRQHIVQELGGDAIRHQGAHFVSRNSNSGVVGSGSSTARGLNILAAWVDRGNGRDAGFVLEWCQRPFDWRGVVPLTTLEVTAVCTETWRLKIRRHLPLHHDLLQGFEDGFAFGEGEAQYGGRELLPLQAGHLR
jgi:hypothetical protein